MQRFATTNLERRLVAGLGGLALVVGGIAVADAAWAVSAGPYYPSYQDCPPTADANTTQSATPGCHNAKLMLADRTGHRYAQAGTDQEAQGDNVHAADASVTPNGTSAPGAPAMSVHADTNWQPIPKGQCGAEDIALYPIEVALYAAGQSGAPCKLDPTGWAAPSQPPTVTPKLQTGTPDAAALGLANGGQLYFGADDNVDTGEHDGVDGKYHTNKAINGPSDGGGLGVQWQPGAAAGWGAAIESALAGSPSQLAQDPVPVATAGGGFCADGICVGAYTSRQTIYHGGGGAGQSRDAYNYQGKTWGPYNCNSGSVKNEQACYDKSQGGTAGGMNTYRKEEARNVVVQPGVQVYGDPDPQASPALPAQLDPLPAAYVGTCGVVAGGGALQAPASPVTNGAGQVVVAPTGC